MSQIIPVPRCEISIRDATMADLPFIDGLQKMHSKQVGWMPEKALVGKIEARSEERRVGKECRSRWSPYH